MSVSAITLTALQNDQARVERIASNLANVTTPGYKRELWVERVGDRGVFGRLMAAGETQSTEAGSPLSSPTPVVASVMRDVRSGTLRPTRQQLDIALAGPGYFELSSDNGPVYTRMGQFHVDSNGRVVSVHGLALMGVGGEISLTGAGAVAIDAEGRVAEGGRPVGQLQLVDWVSEQLTSIGSGLFVAAGAAKQVPGNQAAVRQGFLENANVDLAHEMVSLTSTLRHFEAMLRIAQGRDELLGIAIRKFGEL